MPVDTIPGRFMEQDRIRPDSPAYFVRQGPPESGTWKPTSWRTYVAEVRTAARSLLALGGKPEDTVCILGFNRPEWVIMDIACMSVGGAPAGIYTTCSAEEVQYIISHAESKVVLLEDEGQWEKVNAKRAELPLLKHVVMMKGAPAIDDPMVMTWEEFMAKADGVDEQEVDQCIAKIEPESTATLIYTSGTTGPPKGVMLTHKNLAWTSQIAQGLVGLRAHDCCLSYLPLSHIAEQMFSIHGPITAGASVYFAESIDRVPDNVKEVQPTIFFGVPRIWEKFYAGVSGKLADATGTKAKLVAWARGVATQVNDTRNAGQTPSALLMLQYELANKLIFSKLKPALGLGRARICVTGAAPVAKEILEFFASLDVVIREVYGQSEGCGPTSFNVPGRTRFGSVGPKIPGADVKIADDGEICLRGPNVFAGYYKDEATTNETLIDGWLHSGDLGAFDADGYLNITGRKKDIIITAGGKNITPKNIESSLKNIDIVGEAVLIGDRRKFISALISLDPDQIDGFCSKHGISVDGISSHPIVVEHVQKGVDETNRLFARVEQVRKFTILAQPLSVETGELTPTLKVKRKVVNDKFESLIDEMYVD